MSEPDWRQLKRVLLQGGVQFRYVHRAVIELQDHYLELEAEALGAGYSAVEAATDASARLGDATVLATEILQHNELKAYWPAVNAGVAAVCDARQSIELNHSVVRWGQAAIAAALFTTSFLLVLKLLLLG